MPCAPGPRARWPSAARFDEDRYATAKTQITRALTDRGYAYATVQADAQMDLAGHTVDYVFTAKAGIAVVLGPITIVNVQQSEPGAGSSSANPTPETLSSCPPGTGSSALKNGGAKPCGAPLLRAMHLEQGEPYSTAQIDAATQALLDLGVLASAQITGDLRDPTVAQVPITVKIEPTKLHTIRLGGGFEFDEIKAELHGRLGFEDHDFYGDLRNFSLDFTPGVVLYPMRFDNIVTPQHLLLEERTRAQLRQPGFLEERTTGFVRPGGQHLPDALLRLPRPEHARSGGRLFRAEDGVRRRRAPSRST